jgi:hypothetical protein
MEIIGQCHCSNLQFNLTTQLTVDTLLIRACQCSFCQSHGAKCTSDPKGSVQFFVQDLNLLNCYQFGAKTADFLICKICGVYLTAVTTIDGHQWATVNLNITSLRDRPAIPISYDNETKQERLERRSQRWTPVKPLFNSIIKRV